MYRDLQERLLANSQPVDFGYKVNGEPSPCWEWFGHRDRYGYARLSVWVNGKHRKVRAHRLAHEVFLGVTLTADETLDHLCTVTHCIHPNHTEAISNVENVKRMQDRWRHYRAHQAGQTQMALA